MTYESAHERGGKLRLLRHRARRRREPEITRVNLREESLQIRVCYSCYSLVLPDHWDGHVAWHGRIERSAGRKTGE